MLHKMDQFRIIKVVSFKISISDSAVVSIQKMILILKMISEYKF